MNARAFVVLLLGASVLALNDHVLKRAYPGMVTGKLSDVAGMIFFPLLLHAFVWAVVPRARRTDRAHDALLVLACVCTAVAFALTKTTAFGNDAYRVVWGAMQWPLRGARAWLAGRAPPPLARVALVRDFTDLVALPFASLAFAAGARGRFVALAAPFRYPRSEADSARA